jgi:hypothetical protein
VPTEQEKRDRVIRAMTIMACQDCTSHGRLPIAISHDMMPCVVECGRCHHLVEWHAVPVLPKIPPSNDLPHYKVYENLTLPEVKEGLAKLNAALTGTLTDTETLLDGTPDTDIQSKQEAPANTPEIVGPKTGEPIPFQTLATDLGESVRQLFAQVSFMQSEVATFKDKIGGFFQKQWQYSARFAERWHRGYLQHFLDFPFTAIPIECEDVLASRYARLILAPKFYDPGLGIKIAGRGGMRVELMNQYSRMNLDFPLEICEQLDIPAPLDLRVAGNKIIGASVQFCWQDIPGTAEDQDSTPEMRSIYITEPEPARLWLARHGIRPFPPIRILDQELNVKRIDEALVETPGYIDAWKLFVRTGRLGIFWQNAMDARRFAYLVGLAVRGATPVFVVGRHDVMGWHSTWSNIGKPEWTDPRMRNELCFFTNGEPVNWDVVMRAKLAIIDLHSGGDSHGEQLDLNILERMIKFNNKLIVIGPDPFLDFAHENIKAAFVNALAPWQLHEPIKWEDWGTKRLAIDYFKTVMAK